MSKVTCKSGCKPKPTPKGKGSGKRVGKSKPHKADNQLNRRVK